MWALVSLLYNLFQGWEDPYVPRTHEGLLKWKYAHMNSVDFVLKVSPTGTQYHLMLMEKGRLKQLENARVVFPGKYFTVIHLGFGEG
jgi:mRNA-capping enzyme